MIYLVARIATSAQLVSARKEVVGGRSATLFLERRIVVAIYTDSISTSVAFEVNAIQRDADRNLRRLSSGKRILRAEDDAGALQVSLKLDSSRKRADATLLGLQNVRSYTEAQDNALKVVGELFIRLSELARQAIDVTKNETDRAAYDYEFQGLIDEIRRIDLEEFNDIRLFRGTSFTLVDKGANVKWSDAKAEVDAMNDIGGSDYHYLATITSQAEQDEIARQIGDVKINAWLGGNDVGAEGEWRWTEGPEGDEEGGSGRQFWSGIASNRTPPGSAVNGAYENWGSGEPNDAGATVGSENYLQISQGSSPPGSWNDLPDRDNMGAAYQPRGYVRETEEGELPVARDENGKTYDLPRMSYTTGRKGDHLFLPNEVFTSMNVKTVADATRAIELISGKDRVPETEEESFTALDVIADMRAQVGANLSRLGLEIENLIRRRDNLEAAHSRASDLDVSRESTRYGKNSVRLEFGAAILAQANGLLEQSYWKNYV